MGAVVTAVSAIRRKFTLRMQEEGLSDYRLSVLRRWVARLPDALAPDAIAMIEVALDAPRKGRNEVAWFIDNELREEETLPLRARLAFLRWVVTARPPRTRSLLKLRELRDLRDDAVRLDQLVLDLEDARENTTSLAHAHPLLAHAWHAAPESARPVGPVHRGERMPQVGASGTVQAAIFVAREVAHLAPTTVERRFEELLALATRAVGDGKPSRSLSALVVAMARADDVTGALAVARAAAAEANRTLRYPDNAGASARPGVVRAVKLLLESDGEIAVRGFLERLDDELRRLDVVRALALRKKVPSRPIVHAVHRGVIGRETGLWLARLEGGDYALLAKELRQWRYREGPRDEILALIPDASFERAVMAARE